MTSNSPATERQGSLASTLDLDASPSKRKSSVSAHDGENEENGTKKKRRKVNHACVYCRRSHMTCDLERPCARCVKRDIGHLCHDEPRDPPRRSKGEMAMADIAPTPENSEGAPKSEMQPGGNELGLASSAAGGGGGPPLAQPTPLSPAQLRRPSQSSNSTAFLQNFNWNNHGVNNQFQDMHHLHPNYMFNTSEVTNEYNLLNDFLSTSLLDDDGALYSNDDAQAFLNDPLLVTNAMSTFQQLQQSGLTNSQPQPQPLLGQQSMLQPNQPPSKIAGEEISRPNSAFPASEHSRNKFYMTAADPAGLSSADDRLHKLLKAKYDAGMLKPFNYVKGYARLNSYMSAHLSRESQFRILKQLDRFRPKFREAMQSLTDMQLVLVEMWFERSLMEYDRVFASMAIPACCWRRTGEIFRGNREMAELVGVPWEKLRDGTLAIHDIIAEDSLVSYWEKFGAIAFDASQKAILTSCVLKIQKWDDQGEGSVSRGEKVAAGVGAAGKEKGKPGARETVKCCFSFTIRRDTHNIPSLIVGNFLPVRKQWRSGR